MDDLELRAFETFNNYRINRHLLIQPKNIHKKAPSSHFSSKTKKFRTNNMRHDSVKFKNCKVIYTVTIVNNNALASLILIFAIIRESMRKARQYIYNI